MKLSDNLKFIYSYLSTLGAVVFILWVVIIANSIFGIEYVGKYKTISFFSKHYFYASFLTIGLIIAILGNIELLVRVELIVIGDRLWKVNKKREATDQYDKLLSREFTLELFHLENFKSFSSAYVSN